MKKRKLTIVIWIVSAVVALGAGVFALTEKCVHTGSWSEWETVKEATCSVEGLKTRKCARCREVENEKIEKLAHVPGNSQVTQPATCLQDGTKTTYCSVCNNVAGTTTIEARGYHLYEEDFSRRVNATCTEDGRRYLTCSTCKATKTDVIEAIGHHSWDDDNPDFFYRPAVEASCTTEGYTAHKECKRCGEKNDEYSPTDPQHPNTPTEFDKGELMDCWTNTVGYKPGRQCPDCGVWVEGHEEIPVEHKLEGEWIEEEKSTCSVAGKESQACSICGQVQIRKLPLLDHEFNLEVPAKMQTCLEEGWTAHMACEKCGRQNANYQVIPKTGHSFNEYGLCDMLGCNAYTYEFKPNGDGTYSLSKIIVVEGDTRNYFEIPSVCKINDVTYNVTGVLDYACEGLALGHKFVIVLPETIKFIGDSAFENCVELESVLGLERVETIGESAFEGCSSLKEVNLEGAVTIGRSAFKDCTALETVALTEKTTSIGYMAFRNCKNLVELTVPYIGSLENDGNEFGYIFGTNEDAPTRLVKVVVLKATKVGSGAFAGAGSLQQIVLPKVTTLESGAFARCVSLNSVYVGEDSIANDFSNVTTIEANAFESVKFMEITLPFIGNGVDENKLGYVFGGEKDIENDSVPQSLKVVKVAFATEVPSDAFKGSKYIEKVVLPAGVTEIGDSAFSGCASLKELDYVAEDVTRVGALAFADCVMLESLTLPFLGETLEGSYTNIGYVFSDTMENLEIPETLKSLVILNGETIAPKAFAGCSDIVSITIPAVSSIGEEAFKGCSALKYIQYADLTEVNYLPKDILSIGEAAFEGCFAEGFETYWDEDSWTYVQETVSLTLPFVGRDENMNTEKPELERIGYIFGKNGNAVDMPVNLTTIRLLSEKEIAKEAFLECQYLEKIVFSDNLEKIGLRAFKDCTALEEVVVPENAAEIAYGAFEGCLAIEKMTLPFIGKTTFAESGEQYFGWFFGIDTSSKHEKEWYKMPESVSIVLTSAKQLLNSAFIDCACLTDIEIPSTLTLLDADVFKNCVNLEKVEFVTVQDEDGQDVVWNLEKIGYAAFANCTKLEKIELPVSVDILDENAFLCCSSLKRIVTQGNVNDALVVREIRFAAFRFAFAATVNNFYFPTSENVVVKIEGLEVLGAGAFRESNVNVVRISNIEADPVEGTEARELKKINEWTFFDCNELTTLVLPDTIETIGSYGVAANEKLTAFRMPKAINFIGGYAFSDCTALTVLNDNDEEVLEFNKGVEIGNSAFENCARLKELAFTFDLDFDNPEVVRINMSAFSGCSNLEWVYLPYNSQYVVGGEVQIGVVSIGSKAFYQCGAELNGNMTIYYLFDLTGYNWDKAWHEGANLGITDEGEANKRLLELTDVDGDNDVDYDDYKAAKLLAQNDFE